MFGYIIANSSALSPEEEARYRGAYCGLCREIGRRSGQPARLSLTYDLTFLILLLSSLYEPEETVRESGCIIHPTPREWFTDTFTGYAADLNVYLTYHKLLDDRRDEAKVAGALYARVLERQVRLIESRWPQVCGAVRDRLEALRRIEEAKDPSADAAANVFGELMGELFVYDPEDHWAGALRRFGRGIGRFVYLMDAAVDYEKDRKSGSYNPLILSEIAPESMREPLMLVLGEAMEDFERLPLVQDLSLMRNILYSGVWQKYNSAYPPPEQEEEHG